MASPPDLVINALLCVGLNAANRLHGPEFVIAHLHKLIEVFEEKGKRRQSNIWRSQ